MVHRTSTICFWFLFLLGFCKTFSAWGSEDRKLLVGVSVAPQKGFVEKIGGEKVKVFVLIPPGYSPHIYELRPSDIVKLTKLKMYVFVGINMPFEKVIREHLKKINKACVHVDMSRDVPLIRDGHAAGRFGTKEPDTSGEFGDDPHIWLSSPKYVKKQVNTIYEELAEIDPESKKYYARNMKSYFKELDLLDREIKAVCKNLKNRKFIVFHPSFSYFARDYKLTQIPIEVEGKEPSAKQIKRVIDIAKRDNIRVVFSSFQVSSESAKTLARQIDGEVVSLDPLGEDYVTNIRKIADAFSKAMK